MKRCCVLARRLSMSLKSLPIPPIPEETARVAHAVFPRGNVVMQVRDALGSIYTDETCADLFPTRGHPASSPWRLALGTVFQFLEGLTDRQVAEAVRDRIAWKYALSLELADTGFDHSSLGSISHPPGPRSCRTAPVGSAVGAVPGRGMAQSTRTTTDRLDPCAHHRSARSIAPCASLRPWSLS